MKPTAFKLVMNDDAIQFEDQINHYLTEGYSFLGDFQIKENVFVQAMVKVEPITPVAMPKITEEKKGNK